MRPNLRLQSLLAASILILGIFVCVVLDRNSDESDRSVAASRTAVRMIEAMNAKNESVLNGILAESIDMNAVSGGTAAHWVLSRQDLVEKVTVNEVKSFNASNFHVRERGEEVDVQVFLRTTFNSERGEFQHMAEHVFTFAGAGDDWKLIEITREDSPLTFWQTLKNAPDLILTRVFGLMY